MLQKCHGSRDICAFMALAPCTEKEAIREAIKAFDIPPERQNRVVVTQLNGGED